MAIRVLIADDQEMVRTGFRMIVDSQPDMQVVGEAADGAEAVALAHRLRPDVCLFDIRMPRMDGLEATRALAGPGVADPPRIVIVTTFDMDEYVYGALRGGAVGFLLKDSGPALLVEAVRAAANGGSLVSPSITVRLLERLARPRPVPAQPSEPLTGRELDVVRLVARGRTNEEIAGELFVSLSTVKTHLGSLSRKLNTRNRVETAAWAWESGLMT
ncbi:response regulator transcription factor [Actinomadura madurae]|uniref:DNA-binding response regulator, NarL/FixJ family, contains REC and HTH domains n=1 Tax=Actinomadura madurae TaxID=1993 RepID=A0A1I5KTR6_9ACTN|nr:response regulator transcription factor [Actinomadura madurae]URM95268.1 response regulator transcription factor [Actinomadura madurae]URN05975.1 response regulator transcription factor [Actinomadura madurae]SFO88348.1 DNA-binding response regulator, NarL/FixJ family, contains REC and HTH domains [Actinomadura madurae]SPT49867.1 Response regulator protein vraR [Actinomadura madurae]